MKLLDILQEEVINDTKLMMNFLKSDEGLHDYVNNSKSGDELRSFVETYNEEAGFVRELHDINFDSVNWDHILKAIKNE